MRKAFFLINSILLLSISCQKETLSDDLDAFIGQYDYTFNTVGEDDTGTYTFTGAGVMLVARGGPNLQLLFTDDDGSTYDGFYLEDGNFRLMEDVIESGGSAYRINGEGFFGNDNMQLVISTEAIGFFDNSIITMIGTKR